MNFTQWGDKVTWDWILKRPQMITSLEWDPMSWMTSDNEVEIRVRSMEDFQKKSMKGWPGWDRGHVSKLVSKYDTMPIGRAKFLLALKEAAI
jgi:hypothetical protein